MANKLSDTEKAIASTRAQNLNKLIGEIGKRGRISEFADKYDLNASYISQVINGHRLMGDRAARRFEKLIGLNAYDLDQTTKSKDTLNLGKLSTDEIKLLKAFAAADIETQIMILKIIETLAK